MVNDIFVSFPAVQIYELSYIHLYFSPFTGILRALKVVTSKLVEQCTGIAEVTGSNPVQA